MGKSVTDTKPAGGSIELARHYVADRRRGLAFVFGAVYPLQSYVAINSPVTVSIPLAFALLVGTYSFLAPNSGDSLGTKPTRVVRVLTFLFFAAICWQYGVANLTVDKLQTSAFGLRSGEWRPLLQLVSWLAFVVAVSAVVWAFRERSRALSFMGGFVGSMFVVSAYAIASWVGRLLDLYTLPVLGNLDIGIGRRLPELLISGSILPRESGTGGEPKAFGWLIAVALIFLMVGFAGDRRRSPTSLRIWQRYGLLLVFAAALLSTFSTEAWLVAAFVTALLPVLNGLRVGLRRKSRAYLPLAAVCFAVVALWFAEIVNHPLVRSRLSGEARYSNLTNSWSAAVSMISEAPLAGHGMGSHSLLVVDRYTSAYGLGWLDPGFYLYQLVEGGVVGAAPLFIAIAILLRLLYLKARSGVGRLPLVALVLLCAWCVRALATGFLDLDAALAVGSAIAVGCFRSVSVKEAVRGG